MKVVTIIARVLLGFIFVVFGSNIIPAFPSDAAARRRDVTGEYFSKAFFVSGYLYVIGGLQVDRRFALVDRSLCSSRLDDSCRVIVNIWIFHILMAPSRLSCPQSLSTILELFLVWRYRDAFRGILNP